ncbi:ubiquinone/menaquinone biosynthesis methyltransferase [Thermosulfidibacter takaii ABI70S6]|uniref:Demethylmenaquinone methyltransferase n=1 Tax=Thermosulfidibacter takaii (strain DSM 17441 / JCM 13301 / NBRC 103674 / ABI70S6) TaxID=1298851 RepID=A0A0S3QRC6_THET7|nr:bifunctional demethylmenaquinone methyltransferase/2-methoxy-6-polyprenyl-1,4-benzoquinol methylase UbiE [Thermosulfidibacter takaii]BAT70867.1 ubiquinone/menaquinone biosynthesis methyltransferase [Thermosulfidibacter takaii ABI70S6]
MPITHHMFNRISRWYDLLNHLLSAGQDIIWRRKAVERLLEEGGDTFLDVASGTGDVAFEILRQKPNAQVTALDPAKNMLLVAKRKAAKKRVKLYLVLGQGEKLPFRDKSFDGITIAFGIRNVVDRNATLREFHRVLRDNGVVVILEFSKPRGLFGVIYNLYFHKILPFLGWLISKDKEAYSYLPNSVEKFPKPSLFAKELMEVGFKRVMFEPYTMGICYCYKAYKA